MPLVDKLLGRDSNKKEAAPKQENQEKFKQAQEALTKQGVFSPEPPNRMDCAPNPKEMVKAIDQGIKMAESMGNATNRNEAEKMADAGFFGLVFGTAKFVKDSFTIQKCMDKQDEEQANKVAAYNETVQSLANTFPDPVNPVKENTKSAAESLPTLPLKTNLAIAAAVGCSTGAGPMLFFGGPIGCATGCMLGAGIGLTAQAYRDANKTREIIKQNDAAKKLDMERALNKAPKTEISQEPKAEPKAEPIVEIKKTEPPKPVEKPKPKPITPALNAQKSKSKSKSRSGNNSQNADSRNGNGNEGGFSHGVSNGGATIEVCRCDSSGVCEKPSWER